MKLFCCSKQMEHDPLRASYVCKECGNFVSTAVIEDNIKPLLDKYQCVRLPKILNEILIQK